MTQKELTGWRAAPVPLQSVSVCQTRFSNAEPEVSLPNELSSRRPVTSKLYKVAAIADCNPACCAQALLPCMLLHHFNCWTVPDPAQGECGRRMPALPGYNASTARIQCQRYEKKCQMRTCKPPWKTSCLPLVTLRRQRRRSWHAQTANALPVCSREAAKVAM